MDGPLRRTIEARYLAPIALLAWVVGYLHGYGVGEREGQDSDPRDPVIEGNTIGNTGAGIRMWSNGG